MAKCQILPPFGLRYFSVTLALAILGLRGDQGRTDKRARPEQQALRFNQSAQQRKELPGETPCHEKMVNLRAIALSGTASSPSLKPTKRHTGSVSWSASSMPGSEVTVGES